jgi:hypothetical protein
MRAATGAGLSVLCLLGACVLSAFSSSSPVNPPAVPVMTFSGQVSLENDGASYSGGFVDVATSRDTDLRSCKAFASTLVPSIDMGAGSLPPFTVGTPGYVETKLELVAPPGGWAFEVNVGAALSGRYHGPGKYSDGVVGWTAYPGKGAGPYNQAAGEGLVGQVNADGSGSLQSRAGSFPVGLAQNTAGAHFSITWACRNGGSPVPTGLVVNSTATTFDNPESLAKGECDTTAAGTAGEEPQLVEKKPICTLTAAFEVANKLGGQTITFDIPGDGIPRIANPPEDSLTLSKPTTINGETQPGSHLVQVYGSDPIFCRVACTIRGLVLDGPTNRPVQGAYLFLAGDGNVVQDDFIGTDPTGSRLESRFTLAIRIVGSDTLIGGSGPGEGNVLAAQPFGAFKRPEGVTPLLLCDGARIVGDDTSSHDNRIVGNAIGVPRGSPTPFAGTTSDSSDLLALCLRGSNDTVGGPAAVEGNTIGLGAYLTGPHDIVQSNTFTATSSLDLTTYRLSEESGLIQADATTVGGATSTPGSPPGNVFDDSQLSIGANLHGNVVQGNLFRGQSGDSAAILIDGQENTIGGRGNRDGNLIEGYGRPDPQLPQQALLLGRAGIVISGAPVNGSLDAANVIEHNVFRDNDGSGAVSIFDANYGNDVYANEMSGNSFGISLGGAFRPNPPSDVVGLFAPADGPNELQPYPVIRGLRPSGGELEVTGTLERARPFAGYQFDLYSQTSCTPAPDGQGERWLGRSEIHTDANGVSQFTLFYPVPVDDPDRVFTATATSPAGSTSEFSPCVALGS